MLPRTKCEDLQLGHLGLHSVALAPGLGRGSAPPADQQYAQQHPVKRGAVSAFRNHGAAGVSLTDNALHQARPRHRTDRVGEAEDDFSRAAEVEREVRDRASHRMGRRPRVGGRGR